MIRGKLLLEVCNSAARQHDNLHIEISLRGLKSYMVSKFALLSQFVDISISVTIWYLHFEVGKCVIIRSFTC